MRAGIYCSLVFLVLSGSSCGRSLGAADDAIRSVDDIYRASDNVADDFGRLGVSSTDELRSQANQIAAQQFRSRVQRAVAAWGVPEANADEIVQRASCVIADYYVNFGTWPDQAEVEDWIWGLFGTPGQQAAQAALNLVQELANESLSFADFAATVSAGCALQ